MNPRILLPLLATSVGALAAEPPLPQFRAVTIDDQIQIGYGLAIADVDGDGRSDILLADKKQFVWYRNPGVPGANATPPAPASWDKFLLAENLTEKDNVCIAAQDLDGDGKAEVAVGAEWNPGDTVRSGAVFYLQAPADRTQRWTPHKFPEVEPTTHRMRWFRTGAPQADGTTATTGLAEWGLAVVPLHGRGNKNGEGAPVKVLAYYPPASVVPRPAGVAAFDPALPWRSEVISDTLHMTHNFTRLAEAGDPLLSDQLLIGGREGLVVSQRKDGKWLAGEPPGFPGTKVGVGEVRVGALRTGVQFTTTVEPMHGNSLVVYSPGSRAGGAPMAERRVLTEKMVDGHALACGDLLGGSTGSEQIVVGWRGKPGQEGSNIGLAVWTPLDAKGEKWRETVIDPDGMACEDLMLADLDGDGKLDIVAAGRGTKNVKIYFNQTPRAGK